MRIAVAEAWEQLRNPGEGECPPLEAVTRGLVGTNPDTISSHLYVLQYIQNFFIYSCIDVCVLCPCK
jgi:hypothetical protein